MTRSPFWLQLPISLVACAAIPGAASAFFSPGGVGAASLCFILIALAACCGGCGGLGGASFHNGPPSTGETLLRVLALALFAIAVLAALLAWSSLPPRLPIHA